MLAALLITSALAADRVEAADSLAMGSTGVGNPYVIGAVAANPATPGTVDKYDFSLAGSYGQRGLHWHIGAVDTETSPLALGLVYSGDRFNPPLTTRDLPGWQVPGTTLTNLRQNHDLTLSAAVPFWERRISIGVGGSLSFYNHERTGKGTTGNMTAGLAFKPDEHLVIGLSGRNVLPIDDPTLDRPLELLGGFWAGKRGVAGVAIDGGARLDSSDPLLLSAGLQVDPSATTMVRAGYRLEEAVHHVAIGAGAGTPDAAMDLGMQVPTNAFTKPAAWTFQLSLRLTGPDLNRVTPDG